MIKRGVGACFPLEEFKRLPILAQGFRQEFESDEAAGFCIFGPIDHAHPLTPELFEDAVVRNHLTNHDG